MSIEFVVRARAAPVTHDRFLAAVGTGQGVEYLADIIRASLFLAQGHRDDVHLNLVLERSDDFSRILTFRGDCLGSLPGLHESALLAVIAEALKAGEKLGKDASVTDDRGIVVTTTSFEHLVKSRTENARVMLLDTNGPDIRSLDLESEAAETPVFLLTDHTPMPRKTLKSMARQGVTTVSVGPRILHAAQCITVLLNERDRRQAGWS